MARRRNEVLGRLVRGLGPGPQDRLGRAAVTSARFWLLAGASGVVGVALVTVIIGVVEQRTHLANGSLLYLVVVLAVAAAFGRWPAVLTALAAFLAFNWFFVEPAHTLSVADSGDWITLLTFLSAAIVTGQLAGGQRRRAEDASRREREALVLYEAARAFGDNPLESALRIIAERLRLELLLESLVIDVADGPGGSPIRINAGASDIDTILGRSQVAPFWILGRDPAQQDMKARSPIRWIRAIPPSAPHSGRLADSRAHVVPITSRGRRLGSIVLLLGGRAHFSESENRLLAGVAEQLAQNIDRARLRDQATATEVLRRTDAVKTALLSAVSHDLRTPLASIIASAGSLRQRDVEWTEADVLEFADTIEQEARRLDRIVGNLLDLSRIQGGSMHAQKEWHDLGALVDDVLGRLRAITAGHRLVVDVPDDLSPIPLDYVQIDQVVSNLVENAVKYTPDGTAITVRASSTASEVRVEVLDRGPGFPAAALPHVFEPFYRADARSSAQGTGLGLAVARGLIEAHGGRIWAENLRDGGARVVFTLPLGTEPSKPEFVARAG